MLTATVHRHAATSNNENGNTGSGCTRYAHYISHLFCITNYLTGPPTTTLKNERLSSFSRVVDTAATRDAMRRGKPPLCCVSFTYRRDGRGFPPSRRVSFHTDATRRGKPSSVVFLCNWTRREWVYPFSLGFFPYRRDERGETPSLLHSFHIQTRREGVSPFSSCFFPQTRREGGNPLSVHIQMRREGVYPFSSCFFPHRHDEKRETLFRRVSLQLDATRVGLPLLVGFFPYRRDERGETLSGRVFFAIGHDERGIPLPVVTQTQREGMYLLPCFFFFSLQM